MHRLLKPLFISASFSAILLGALAEAQPVDREISSEFPRRSEAWQNQCGQDPCCPSRLNINLGYTSPRGISRDFGYATVGALYFPKSCGALSPFLDLRIHYLDTGRWAGNFGFGFEAPIRFYPSTMRGYVYYDFRDTPYCTFGQFCVGAQWFGPCFDATLNTYWPTRAEGHARRETIVYPGGFKASRYKGARSYQGAELLLSKLVCLCDYELYLSAGPYYFYGHEHTKSAGGGKFRIDAQIFNGLLLGVQGSYDCHYDFRICGQVTWTFPWCNPCCQPSQCWVPVVREEVILLHKDCFWRTNY